MMIALLMVITFVLMLFALLEAIRRVLGATALVATYSAIFKSTKFLVKAPFYIVIAFSIICFAAGTVECPPLAGLFAFAAFCIWCYKALRKTYN